MSHKPAIGTESTAFASLAMLVAAVGFAISVFPTFDHNDFMYTVAPSLLADYSIYEDLGFVQAPGSIWLYASIHAIVRSEDFHLFLRLLSLLLLFGSVLLTTLTAKVIADRNAAILAAIAIITSPNIVSIGEEIGNTPLALFLLSGAIFLHLANSASNANAFIVGLLVGLAATSKLNFSIFAIPFALFYIVDQGLSGKHLRSYIAGGVIGSGLIWYYLFKSPANFWFFNIEFHHLTNLTRALSAEQTTRKISASLAFFVLHALPQIILCFLAARQFSRSSIDRSFLKVLTIFAVAIVAAIAPLYSASQYLAPAALILGLLAAMAANAIALQHRQYQKRIWMASIAAVGLFGSTVTIPMISHGILLYAEQKVGPLAVREIRARIGNIVDTYLYDSPCPKTALSLSAAPLVGTNLEILPYSSTGPFLPRIADQIARQNPEFTHFSDISSNLTATQPTTLLVGYYPDYSAEGKLLEYAYATGFVAFAVGKLASYHLPNRERQLFLLIRSKCITRIFTPGQRAKIKNMTTPVSNWSPSTIHGPAPRN